MKRFTPITLAAVTCLALAGNAARAATDPAQAHASLRPGEVAANGPIPGDVTLYTKEFACQQAIPTPGYLLRPPLSQG